VVFKSFLYPEPRETRWSGLGNQTAWFGGCCELAPTSILVSAFSSETLFCSAATFSGPLSVSGFALLLLAKPSLVNLV
jgi:hypothetical protein